MRTIYSLNIEDLMPTATEVLESQGMAGRRPLPASITRLLDSALDLFHQHAEPRGLLEDWPIHDFEDLYGNDLNSREGPVPGIVSRADALALFAATMGDALATQSSALFAQGSAALGFMMDAVNSAGAERLGRLMGRMFHEHLPEQVRRSGNLKVQYYCPGHCGWHISGQSRLFQALRPEEIGMTLKPSFVMHPFKSISGILVAGDMAIHRFRPDFSFCPQCKEHTCVPRLRLLENTH